MINGDFTHCKNLTEFYAEIRACHENAHGKDYVEVHDALRSLITYHTRYKEFGVNQGGTAGAVLLKHPLEQSIYDKQLVNWLPYRKIFFDEADFFLIKFKAKNCLSTDKSTISKCDVCYIDTKHSIALLRDELAMHSSFVKKHLVCHDTFAIPKLQRYIEKFCDSNPWKIVEYNKKSVGFTILERTNEDT